MGLIPAWAGKTKGGTTLHQGSWAHPRVGGENSHPSVSGEDAPWLIPAWAGKTSLRRQAWLGQSAHPRVGGENQRRVGRRELPVGSSPRGRGKRDKPPLGPPVRRLIPAWAGKTTRR